MKKSGREDLGEKDVYMKALFLRCHMLSLPLHYLFFFLASKAIVLEGICFLPHCT